jgi:hypothetical protein
MTSKAKAKGNGAERAIAKFLSDLFGGSFIRVPNSGAYIGGTNAIRKEFLSEGQVRGSKGDILPPDFMPKLVIESKFYADFQFHSLITPGGLPQLDTWIKQQLDCVDDTDVWFVIFKINRRGSFIVVPHEGSEKYTFGNHAVYTGVYGKFIVTEMEEFFKNNKDIIAEITK